jgi:hypothetical protein
MSQLIDAELTRIRGLADHFAAHNRWMDARRSACDYDAEWDGLHIAAADPSTGEDSPQRIALLEWTHREMSREVARRRHSFLVGDQPTLEEIGRRRDYAYDSEALAHHVAQLLGGPFTEDPHGEHGLAWTLCEAAGWPSNV